VKSFFEQEKYELKDIQTLIEIQAEETLYLEFKGGKAFAKDEKSVWKIAAQVSSFANSDGGVIIYGLAEFENKAHLIQYIDAKEFSKEWLQNIIDSKIQKKLSTFEIQQIENPKDPFQVIYLLKIKPSPQAPHMTAEKKYFRRTSTGKIAMEEYDLQAAYFRNGLVDLEFDVNVFGPEVEPNIHGNVSRLYYNLEFFVKNVGNELALHYKLEIVINPFAVNSAENVVKNHKVHGTKQQAIVETFSFNNVDPIFPNEAVNLCKMRLNFHKNNLAAYQFPFYVRLYYQSGKKIKTFFIDEMCKYKGGKIDASTFQS
jgi:hypothetical protein